jgi:hypothetical protein
VEKQMIEELEQLLNHVKAAFAESDIKKRCDATGQKHKWNYSLITGACLRKETLIVGFNWGAKNDTDYKPQTTIESTVWRHGDLGSLARVRKYLTTHFPSALLDKISQTNCCFFRSKSAGQITEADLRRCQPIFMDLIQQMRPSLVVCVSDRARTLLKGSIAQYRDEHIHDGEKTVFVAAVGRLCGKFPAAFLPHPGRHLRSEARNAAWNFCARSIRELQ